ncbi:hypothetical protein IGI04_007843 [Brassica rapa subsp. trilocularis]|uniref:RBR-type E3 ubiquitin transferase n=1 Tax=Brassica rapa subsp. trilocularis TaxID=1813537 RepID=A0ABQ7NP57_BRACM|nr:hypothetical protein IGI04_007843 [Brassica rapa subsp. trilocularis]
MVNGFPTIDGPTPSGKPSSDKHSGKIDVGHHMYSLYFKGLVSEDSLAGFGVAILGQKDELVFQMKGPIHGTDITVLEAELSALKRGLTEAADLGINHITIYSDNHPTHDLISGRLVPKENNMALLVNDVQRIRGRFSSSFTIFVSRCSIKHAYKLARETIVSEQISIPVDTPPRRAKPARKMTCAICLDDDVNADQMFTVDKCGHRFCSECVKRHIEVRLLEGSVMTCPQFRCKSELNFYRCADLLTPKLREIWRQRIRENSIPFEERVYCPNPKCSALMRVTELSKLNKESPVRRCCEKCGEPFCTNCKFPWHDNLSCDDFKIMHPNLRESELKLHALANQKLWRQCGKCQHMIELSKGCVLVVCRCGHKFCYRCGANARSCTHGLGHMFPPQPQELESPPPAPPCWAQCLCWLFLLLCVYFISVGIKS